MEHTTAMVDSKKQSHGASYGTARVAFTLQPWGITSRVDFTQPWGSTQHSHGGFHTAMGHYIAPSWWPSQYNHEASNSTARIVFTVQPWGIKQHSHGGLHSTAMRHHTAQPGWPQFRQPWGITQHSQGDLHNTASHESSHSTARVTSTVQPTMRHHTTQPGRPSQYSQPWGITQHSQGGLHSTAMWLY